MRNKKFNNYDVINLYCPECEKQATEQELHFGICSECGAVMADEPEA